MEEPEILYRYTEAELAAEAVGLKLSVTRADFVLRDQTRLQEYARCATLAEVEGAIERRKVSLQAS